LIESIRLRNWKAHSDSLFEFGKGTNVLVGQMGSGKSSVMDALCFALFGSFPGLQSRRVSIEEVIKSKPNREEETGVELRFSYGGKKYRVERKIKRKGSTEAKIFLGEKLLAGPKPRDVNQAVEKAIEINYNLFSRAVYSEQNEIDFFLRLSPRERKTKFDELLDLQKYEQVRANAVTALNRLKSIAKDKKAFVEEQKKAISGEDQEKLLKKIGEKEKEGQKLQGFAEKCFKEAQGLGLEVKKLEVEEKLFRNLKEKLAENKAVALQAKKYLEETRKGLGGKGALEIGKEKESVARKRQALEKRILELQKLEEKCQARKTELGKQAALSQRKVEDLGKHLNELKGLGAECPTCRQKLETETREKLVEETEAEAKKFALEMENALKQEAEANKELAGLKGSLENMGEEKEGLREKEIVLERLKENLGKLGEKEKQVEGLGKESREIEARLKESSFDEKELIEKRKNAVEKKAASDSAKKEIEGNSQLVSEMRASLERIEKARKQVLEIEESVAGMEAGSEKMNYFINSLVAAQHDLREMLIATINQAMHGIWQKIYPYQDFVSAKMEVDQGSYELRVKERAGDWVRVEGILSGGERSAAAICIRIAFSLVLARNLSWLILDEPTHNLDRNAVETLGKMMQSQLPELVDQVFVITHNREMEKAASAALYKLERDKDQDGATRPVLLPGQN